MSQNKTTNNHPLFVNDGNDVVFQKGPSSANLNGFPLSTYKHTESGMRVMLCSIPRPLFTLNIFVPTIGHDNKGHPHTLEHLIFCGSKKYPDRGYLDSLANCNLANGTNAWTANDHTCYTFEAASEEALANILPVYLDHVLNPLLKDEQFISEVYHFDQTGKEQGVVFSEMVARENDQYDLLFNTMDRLMYAPESPYTFETGGLTKSLPKLTNAEVIDYHRKFYDPNNITVVITGPLSDKFVPNVLQTIPREIIQSHGSNSRTPIVTSLSNGGPEKRFVHAPFPSDDTDTGAIGFDWHGPDADDVETITALNILMDYLAKNASSPLRQRFVERSIPLAGSIYYGAINRTTTNIYIGFDGVPYHKNQNQNEQDPDLPHLFDELYYQNLLIQELRRVLNTKFDGDNLAMAKICQQVSDTMAVRMEENPKKMIIETLGEVIVARHFGKEGINDTAMISANAKIFDIYKDLSQRPIKYWLDLLKKWFCENPVYCTAMVPDAELGSKLEAERKAIEKQNAASIVDKESHDKIVQQAMDASKVNLPSHVRQSMPMADITKTTSLSHKHILEPAAPAYSIGPVSAHQLVYLDTNFVSMAISTPLSMVSDDLRPFLVLFQELTLNSDILLPKGMVYDAGKDGEQLTTVTEEHQRIGYTEVTNKLASLTTSKYGDIGFGNCYFTCSMLDEFFILRADIPKDLFKQAIRWLLQAFMFADFTADRILSVAQKLLSKIDEWKRDGNQMVAIINDYLTTKKQAPNMPRWMDQHMSIFEQESVLKYVVDQTKNGNVEAIVSKLNAIKLKLIDTTGGGFLKLGIPKNMNGAACVEVLSTEWNTCLAAIKHNCSIPTSTKIGKWPFPVQPKARFLDLSNPTQVHVPISSLQASYVYISIKCDLYRAPDFTSSLSFEQQLAQLPALDFYALDLLLTILDCTDGPLYAAIRGKGYAYGAQFENNYWDDKLGFRGYRASNAPKTILAMQKIVTDVGQNWDKYVTEYEIGMAKSLMVYNNINRQATPASLLETCEKANFLGFETAKQADKWRSTHLAAVTNKDLRRVYDQYLSKLADPNYPAFTTLVTPPDTEIPSELGKFKTRTLNSFILPYKD